MSIAWCSSTYCESILGYLYIRKGCKKCGEPKCLSYVTSFELFDYNVHGKYVNKYKRTRKIRNDSST